MYHDLGVERCSSCHAVVLGIPALYSFPSHSSCFVLGCLPAERPLPVAAACLRTKLGTQVPPQSAHPFFFFGFLDILSPGSGLVTEILRSMKAGVV